MSSQETAPAPFAEPNPPSDIPETQPDKWRQVMTRWARWAIANRGQFTYVDPELPDPEDLRWHMVRTEVGSLPQYADCSGFVTGLAKWAGAGDPNGEDYTGGYTGTLLEHCNHIAAAAARMGDLIVYGPGTGRHVVYIMERLPGNDFWCASMGKPGDPSRVRHSELAAYFHGEATFLRWLS